MIVDSIAGLGGIACVNATAVLYEGNPAPLAHAIGERLAALRPPPNVDEKATLPTTPIANARALSDFLGRKAVRAQAVLGADQIIADLGDGYAPLRPDRARAASTRRGHHQRRVASPLRVGGGPVTRGRPLSSISWSPSQPSPTSTAAPFPLCGPSDPTRRLPGRLPDAQQGVHPDVSPSAVRQVARRSAARPARAYR